MRIIIAPDKFKGSLTAPEVAYHLEAGLRSVDPTALIERIPVADGGEGSLDAAIGSGFTRRSVTVTGPTGLPLAAAFAVRQAEAVIELAAVSGLDVLPGGVHDARGATSRGTGELVVAALDAGCTDIVLAVGGSASTDGGSGLLCALGARLRDAKGKALPDGGAALSRLVTADLSALDPRLAMARITLASDVDNPLVGPHGAARVFGPQKGASPADVEALDAALTNYARVLTAALGQGAEASIGSPGAGAAGGVGYAAMAVLGAERRAGIDVVLEYTGLEERILGADLVITGEGSLDEQSLGGKTPVGVARAARLASVPVIAVCGRTTLAPEQLRAAGFDETYALTDHEPDVAACMDNAGPLLQQIGALLGARFLAGKSAGHINERVRT